MVGVEHFLIINTGVSSVVLFVLFLWLIAQPVKQTTKKEKRVYLSKDMNKIKQQITDSEINQ
ncbi:MAG: hypothetical protein ACP5NS_03140 [Candidatus Pacearchaeota archaeon]